MSRSLIDAGIVAGGTGAAHFLAHNRFGNPAAFEQAGVMQAGLTITAVAFVLSLLVGQEGSLALSPQRARTMESRTSRARRRATPVRTTASKTTRGRYATA